MWTQFNLIDDPWIPIVNKGLVSLQDLFTDATLSALGGTTVEKLAILKLLLAIAQAAKTPTNLQEWQRLGADGLAQSCLEYLQTHHAAFFLYGTRPFLQMPAIARAEKKSFGALLPMVATGNTTILTERQIEKQLTTPEKVRLLLIQMNFALGGKKTDNSIILSPNYPHKTNEKNKPTSAKPGPSMGFKGLLHSFIMARTLQQTLWLNLFTHEDLQQMDGFPKGVGVAPWEQMPTGEDCATARSLKQSYMGRLVGLNRFCLLTADGIHFSEGILHAGHTEGIFDPSITLNRVNQKEIKVLSANPDKRPWLEILSRLNHFAQVKSEFDCLQTNYALYKLSTLQPTPVSEINDFAVWSGGLAVGSNAGEQFVSGSNDYVESVCWFQYDRLPANWFTILQEELQALEQQVKALYACVLAYFKTFGVHRAMDQAGIKEKRGTDMAKLAESTAFAMLEKHLYKLPYLDSPEKRHHVRCILADTILQVFHQFCPNQTARQMDAWAAHTPNLKHYLQ